MEVRAGRCGWGVAMALVAAVGLSGFAFGFAARGDLDELPDAVKKTVEQQAGGAKILEVEKQGTGEGTAYEVEFRREGREVGLLIAADGALLEIDEGIAKDKAPPGVKKAIDKLFGEGAKVGVERRTVFFYEVEAVVEGKEKEVLLTPTGESYSGGLREDDDGAEEDGEDEDDEQEKGEEKE